MLKQISDRVPTDEYKRTLNRNNSLQLHNGNPTKCHVQSIVDKTTKPMLNDRNVGGKEKTSNSSENIKELPTFNFSKEQVKQESLELNSMEIVNEQHIPEVKLDAKNFSDTSLGNVKVELSKENDVYIKQTLEKIDGELLDKTAQLICCKVEQKKSLAVSSELKNNIDNIFETLLTAELKYEEQELEQCRLNEITHYKNYERISEKQMDLCDKETVVDDAKNANAKFSIKKRKKVGMSEKVKTFRIRKKEIKKRRNANKKETLKVNSGDHKKLACKIRKKPRQTPKKFKSKVDAKSNKLKLDSSLSLNEEVVECKENRAKPLPEKLVLLKTERSDLSVTQTDLNSDKCQIHGESMHSKEKKFQCDLCQKRYYYRHAFERHKNMAHIEEEKQRVICDVCGKDYASKNNLSEHHRLQHVEENKKRVPCDVCGKDYSSIKHLREHKNAKHIDEDQQKATCNICGKAYATKKNLREHHKLQHENREPILCPFCGRSFATKSNLKVHIHLHSEEKPHQCSTCSKTFSHQSLLSLHEKCHRKNIICEWCGKRFSDNKSLVIHTSIHNVEKPHQCDQCEKAFSHKSLLRSHVRCHKKSLCCDECGKLFSRMGSLKLHLLYHKKEYIFPCSICDKKFISKKQVREHEKTHSIKPVYPKVYNPTHKCSYCERAFLNSSKLKRHERIHTKEKPYKCPHCDLYFSQTESRNSHIKKTHATTAEDSLQSLNETSLSTTS